MIGILRLPFKKLEWAVEHASARQPAPAPGPILFAFSCPIHLGQLHLKSWVAKESLLLVIIRKSMMGFEHFTSDSKFLKSPSDKLDWTVTTVRRVRGRLVG